MRDRLDLLDAHRRLDEDHVGARRGVDVRPRDRRVETFDGQRIRARDEHQVRVARGGARRAQLLRHLARGDHRLVVVVPAALGKRLVLEVQRRDAGALELAHGPLGVQRIAIAGVGIRDDGHAGVLDDVGEPIDDLAQGKEAEVGVAHAACDTAAGGVDRRKSRPRHEARRQSVPDAGRDDDVAGAKQRPQPRRRLHGRAHLNGTMSPRTFVRTMIAS